MKAGSASSHTAALLAPKQASRIIVLEVVAVTVLALFMAARISPDNPLTLSELFPWVWLAPTLLALRYGILAAISSSAIVLAGWAMAYSAKSEYRDFPAQYFLGGLILTLGAGQFSNIWRERVSRAREVNNYLDQRLESLTRRHYLLRHSYGTLEQDLLARPVTLRNSLSSLRRIALRGEKPSPDECAQELMRILAQTCQLESASLHLQTGDRVNARALASIGPANGVNLRDPLVEAALSGNELCHVQTDTLREARSMYLVAAPIIDAAGARLGLLVVRKMPFLSLNRQTLQLIGVTLGYFADMINMDPRARDLCKIFPECTATFAEELLRLERVHRESGVSSTLVALVLYQGEQEQNNVLADLERQRRKLDVSWTLHCPGHCIQLTILPLYDVGATQGYVSRIENHLKQYLSAKNLPAAEFKHVIAPIGALPAHTLLLEVLEKCNATRT